MMVPRCFRVLCSVGRLRVMTSVRSCRWRVWFTVAVLGAAMSVAAFAQRRFYGWDPTVRNIPYDGRFTFARIRYQSSPEGYWAGPPWVHGYPLAERNLMRIMKDICFLDVHTEDINVVTLDDPELFKYPIAYIIEVGFWTMTNAEVAGLRAYLKKGGFLIVDDFKVEGWRGITGGGWEPFAENVRRVLPEARFYDLDQSHPIFDSFFAIEFLDNFPQAYNDGPPVFRGVYEDNDPSKRLLMMINYNTDVSQFWEWSARGFRPVADTNEAYKLGVNYLLYGMTH
jgi:uncharacterized protein DUF4159